jgi:CHAD domain-containing protein
MADATPLTLEAMLPAAVADAVSRAPGIGMRRIGRPRNAPFGLTWADTADGLLASQGMILEQPRQGRQRLMRIMPPPQIAWRPGSPPELLEILGTHDMPAEAAGQALVPVASFGGTATRLSLADGVKAVLAKGVLRAASTEAPVARLTLAGPQAAVLATMRALAEDLPLLPPRAALAEDARALARGQAPAPRRLGAPLLDPALGTEDALVLAMGHLTEVLLWHAPAAEAGRTPEGVHQMRVAMRRLRSVLRVFRPACDGPSLRGFDARLRELAALLGPARDWDVWLGGLGAEIEAALPEEPRIAALLRAARQTRDAAYAALCPALQGPALRRIAWEAVALVETRPWRTEGDAEAAARREAPIEAFAAGVLAKRWRRIEEAGEDIRDLPDAEFHALRIEAKRMRYAAELFAPLWGRKRVRRFLDRLAEVQEAFGLANDAVVAHALMAHLADRAGRDDAEIAWAGGVAEGWALARARRARAKASAAWEELLRGEIYWNQY